MPPASVSVIVAHPRPASLCHAIADAVTRALRDAGLAVLCHDLYAEGFDPVMRAKEALSRVSIDPLVEAHCAEIAAAAGIVLIHPNWWSGPPAILKGWADRVLRPGVAYGFSGADANKGAPTGLLKARAPTGLLRARAVLVFATANMPREVEHKLLGDPLETLWKKSVFAQCGVHTYRQRVFAPVANAAPAQCAAWLEEAARVACDAFACA